MAKKKKNNNEDSLVLLLLIAAAGVVIFKKKQAPPPTVPNTPSSIVVTPKPTNLLTTITNAVQKIVAPPAVTIVDPTPANTAAAAPLPDPVSTGIDQLIVEDTPVDFADQGSQKNTSPDLFDSHMSMIDA